MLLDRREGEYLVHPKKRSVLPEGLDLLKGTKDERPVQSKAVRNIFMIRHGQYDLDGKTDKERILTSLGELIIKLFNLMILMPCSPGNGKPGLVENDPRKSY